MQDGPRHNDFPWREVAPRGPAGALTRTPRRLLPPPHLATRRSTRAPARARWIGMGGPTATLAVASGAPEPGAAVPSRRTRGTRQGASAPRLRPRPSPAPPLRGGSAGWWRPVRRVDVARHAGPLVEECHHPGTDTHRERLLDGTRLRVATVPWHERQLCYGISGNFRLESVATFARNMHLSNTSGYDPDEHAIDQR
jgi:hypothetical protein